MLTSSSHPPRRLLATATLASLSLVACAAPTGSVLPGDDKSIDIGDGEGVAPELPGPLQVAFAPLSGALQFIDDDGSVLLEVSRLDDGDGFSDATFAFRAGSAEVEARLRPARSDEAQYRVEGGALVEVPSGERVSHLLDVAALGTSDVQVLDEAFLQIALATEEGMLTASSVAVAGPLGDCIWTRIYEELPNVAEMVSQLASVSIFGGLGAVVLGGTLGSSALLDAGLFLGFAGTVGLGVAVASVFGLWVLLDVRPACEAAIVEP